MPAFADWLTHLLEDGESVLAGPPDVSPAARTAAGPVLREAFRRHALDVAGPAIPFDPDAAFAAAAVLAEACWRLIAHDPAAPPPADRLGAPRTPAAHLSADLTLRFLPAVHRRARPRGEDDPLAVWCEAVLRRWPLSGVLAALPAGPESPPEFGHPGLDLLYAEWLADRPHPAWVPPPGPVRDQVDRVFAQLGKQVPVPATTPLEASA
jgi:hypothetical protein